MNGRRGIPILCLAFLASAAAALPPSDIEIVRAEARVEYPSQVTFSLEAESGSEIQTAVLEYGLTGRDCTPDLNLAVPEGFSPGRRIDVEWTWRVASSGNLPPGTEIWWSWRLEDDQGNVFRTERQWVTWIDSVHDWKLLESGNIRLHWYRGTEEYNREFLAAAESAREILRTDIGTWPEAEINIYIYGSTQDMKDALVKEPEWIGGLSFGENQRTIMIGIGRGEEEWGKSTISHELAHTVVDSVMNGCYASLPLWLNEGIAMEAEQFLDEEFSRTLEEAVYYDTLFTLREISYEYQYVDGDPTLTYAESHSATQYVIGEYGGEKIFRLLKRLGQGYTYDNAMLDAFGVDMDELEDAWRASIGADPAPGYGDAQPAATRQSTLPPSALELILSTQTPVPPSPAAATPEGGPPPTGGAGGLLGSPWNFAALCGCGLLCSSGLAVLGAVFLLRRRRTAPPAGDAVR
jgi:hypothetical protein